MLNRYVSFLSSRLMIFDFLYELLEVLTPYSWVFHGPIRSPFQRVFGGPQGSEMSGSTRS